MSIGNTKDYGNKGNNFPYQRSVLKLLSQIACGTSGEQLITSTLAVAGGTVTAGASSVTFTTSAGFTGTINGVARAASTTYTFIAAEGKTLPAILYTVTAGSVLIDVVS